MTHFVYFHSSAQLVFLFQNYSRNDSSTTYVEFIVNESGQVEKEQQVHIGEKEQETIWTIEKTVIHDAENLGFVSKLKLISNKELTFDKELTNCNKGYDLTNYKRRHFFVTIKK